VNRPREKGLLPETHSPSPGGVYEAASTPSHSWTDQAGAATAKRRILHVYLSSGNVCHCLLGNASLLTRNASLLIGNVPLFRGNDFVGLLEMPLCLQEMRLCSAEMPRCSRKRSIAQQKCDTAYRKRHRRMNPLYAGSARPPQRGRRHCPQNESIARGRRRRGLRAGRRAVNVAARAAGTNLDNLMVDKRAIVGKKPNATAGACLAGQHRKGKPRSVGNPIDDNSHGRTPVDRHVEVFPVRGHIPPAIRPVLPGAKRARRLEKQMRRSHC
jgi:hypothetical protein